MTESEVDRIDIRLENVEQGIKDLKELILREISDLKAEQLAYLEKRLDRTDDDQRRAWEAIRALEADRNRAHGGGTVIHGIITTVVAMFTSSAAAVFLTRFFK